jgi:hypothetical protein
MRVAKRHLLMWPLVAGGQLSLPGDLAILGVRRRPRGSFKILPWCSHPRPPRSAGTKHWMTQPLDCYVYNVNPPRLTSRRARLELQISTRRQDDDEG